MVPKIHLEEEDFKGAEQERRWEKITTNLLLKKNEHRKES